MSRRWLLLLLIPLLLAGCGRRPEPLPSQPPQALPDRLVRVFCYHDIVQSGGGFFDNTVEDFTRHLETLKAQGFQSITCRQLADYMANLKDIPEKSVVIAFDDGRESVLTTAKPLLDKYGYTATLFLITGNVGSKGTLNWDQVKELLGAGYEVGSHTATHMNLTKRGGKSLEAHQEAVQGEIEGSAATIEEKLGEPPIALAYPFGNYDTFTMRAVKDAGYQMAFTIDPGAIDNQSDPWTLSRRMIVSGTSQKSFDAALVTEPLHLSGLKPPLGAHALSTSYDFTALVTDRDALAGMEAEAGKSSKVSLDSASGQLSVRAKLRPGANLVRLRSLGTPRRERGWVVICEPGS